MSEQRKVALVTGSATGIGAACAIRFAKRGLAVVVNYSRSKIEAEQTLSAVQQYDVPAILCKANIADEAAVKDMIARCNSELGRLDILVNNAGTTRFIDHTDLEALTDDIWDEILGVNIKGTFYCIRAAMPYLIANCGNIINITSVAGLQGNGSSIPYAVSKAALNNMTKALARAYGPSVRINSVAPGPVTTRWLADHQDHIESSLKITPMQRAATPDDIADAVEYLGLGTTLTTGQILIVDGGRTM